MKRHLTIPALLVATIAATPTGAATSCFSASCAGNCTPDPPVQISTLVPASEFPAVADTPVEFLDPADGRGKFLIPTQEGAILVWDSATAEILPTFFLDLRDDVGGPVVCCGERGLLSMALAPDYPESGLFYVFYTSADLGGGTLGDIIVARYQRSAGNPDVADPGSALQILRLDHPATNHNGGELLFGPNDGFLYITTGDGGGSCDGNLGINGDGQRVDTLHGKVLRIDVHGVDPTGTPPDDCGVGAANYTVPSSNPFSGLEPNCDEIWTMGLRNPFRASFDRETGDLYIGDVGQNKWEEIDLVLASQAAPVNFGWPCREACETSGNNESNCQTPGCPVDPGTTCLFPRASGFWDSALCHYNGGWDSIMGGFRYRGTQVPSIAGDYIYGDAACGQIWKTTTLDPADPGNIDAECWASGFFGTFGFAEDSGGELYVVLGGQSRIDCIHNGNGCTWAFPTIFADGFESGDTSNWSLTVP